MSVYVNRPTAKFLKSIGSADQPIDPNWVEVAPRELSLVDFTRNPSSIRVGDLLVYYAAVHQKIFGIVEVFSKPGFDAGRKRWPHFCEVRPKLIIKGMDRAPSIDALNTPGERNFRKTVQQRDYAALTDAEFDRALAALEAVFEDSEGDIRGANFNTPR